MNPDFDRILTALEGVGFELTAREAAEALWLATHIAQSASTSTQGPGRLPAPGKSERAPARRAPRSAHPPTPATVHAPTTAAATAVGPSSVCAVPVRVADAPALPHELNLLRALRPLKRRVPSRHRVLLDESATAERCAEERLFLPATRPEPERWLSLALIVETGPTMAVWHSLVSELTALLQRTGAFRDIRLWHLHTASDGSTGLHPQAIPTSALHSPREIVDPTGRQAIWCISDCVSALWHDGRADSLLELWGQGGPLAVIQPLPQRLWRRTGLRLEQIRLHTDAPGLPNSYLRTAWPDSSGLMRGPLAGMPVPVLELDPSWLSLWTGLITATAPGGVPAVVTMTSATRDAAAGLDRDTISADAPSDEPLSLVRAFRAHASPQAYRLAGCLATVRLTLPVMRLVQHVMLPESRPAHLAEVLLGGLLHRTHQDSLSPEYDFVDGVRDVLRSTVRHSDTRRVYEEVSTYLAAHAGDARDTQAFAMLPSGRGSVTLSTPSPPFAEITLRDPSLPSRPDPHHEPSPNDQDAEPGPVPAWDKGNPRRVRQWLVGRIVDVLQSSDTMRHGASRNLWREMLMAELDVPVEPYRDEPLRVWLLKVVSTSAEQPGGLFGVVRSLEYVEQPSVTVNALWSLVDEWEAAEFFDYADLQPLQPVLQAMGPDGLTAMARHASRSRVRELPPRCETGWQVFLWLAGENSPASELPPCMAFLALSAGRLVAEGQTEAAELLRRFNRRQAMDLGVTDRLTDWQQAYVPQSAPSLVPAYVLIQLEPDRIDPDRYYLSHWLQSDREGWHPVVGETVHLAQAELPIAVDQLMERVEGRWADLRQPVILEFVLPWELLNEPVEWWCKEADSTYPVPLVLDYPVVLRSLERLQRAAWHRAWHNKWDQLKERPGENYAHWSHPEGDDAYFFRLERELREDPRAVCLVLSEPPGGDAGTGRRELLAGLRAGVPVVIWDRRGRTDDAFREAVHEIVQDLSPDGLMKQVTKWRREALVAGPEEWDRQVGRHLAVLFDDPERKPGPPAPVS
ncbi:SAV_2336 N-terminal domain-related protein [Streptomyces sp. NPDC005799]|uniref:SAV_2336 N-terminal domain-related protein n=1 Tax=Streptomyces sp. NPDC005799 TaxID=3154678 RepID=UPI0034059259